MAKCKETNKIVCVNGQGEIHCKHIRHNVEVINKRCQEDSCSLKQIRPKKRIKQKSVRSKRG